MYPGQSSGGGCRQWKVQKCVSWKVEGKSVINVVVVVVVVSSLFCPAG